MSSFLWIWISFRRCPLPWGRQWSLDKAGFFLQEIRASFRRSHLTVRSLHFLQEITISFRALQTDSSIVLDFGTSSRKIPSSWKKSKIQGDGMRSEEAQGMKEPPEEKKPVSWRRRQRCRINTDLLKEKSRFLKEKRNLEEKRNLPKEKRRSLKEMRRRNSSPKCPPRNSWRKTENSWRKRHPTTNWLGKGNTSFRRFSLSFRNFPNLLQSPWKVKLPSGTSGVLKEKPPLLKRGPVPWGKIKVLQEKEIPSEKRKFLQEN